MSGAASKTSGSMIAQEVDHEKIQFRRNPPVCRNGALAIAAATDEVNPD